MNDLKFAIRQLLRSPGFTLVAILTLALGIGANAAIVTLINTLAFKSVNVPNANRLIGVFQREVENPGNYSFFSFADFRDLQTDKSVFSGLAAYKLIGVGTREGDLMRSHHAVAVSSSYFTTLGVPPLLGRAFIAEEDNAPARSVVLTHPYWQSLGGKADVIGSALRLAAGDFTIVGVMPEGFTGSTPTCRTFFLPAGALPLLWERPGETPRRLEDRSLDEFMVFGRLQPGLSRDAADAGLKLLSEKFRVANPAVPRGRELVSAHLPRFSFSNHPNNFTSHIAPIAAFALTLSAIVLGVACLNLANMLLARGAARRKEIAIRLAIGASRARVLRQLLSEGFLLALIGGLGGLLLSVWSTHALTRLVEETAFLDATPDLVVVSALLFLCCGATICFALGPSWRLASLDVNGDLKQQTGSESMGGRFNVKNILAVAQIALSLALLTAAGLFSRSAAQVVRADIGMPLGTDFIARIDTGLANIPRARAQEIFREAEDRLAQLPGVESVSSARMIPFGGEWHSTDVHAVGAPDNKAHVNQNIVGSDYFKTVGVPLLRGRDFERREAIATPSRPVVIIGAGLAEKFWPGQDAVGRLLQFPGRTNTFEVVGVAPPISWDIIEKEKRENIFFPRGQEFSSTLRLHVNVAPNADSASIMALARKTLNTIDPLMPMTQVATLHSLHMESDSVKIVNIGAMLFGAFGLVALLMSALGIYGLKSFHVARRTREIGIRMALGATARDVIRMIVGEGARLSAIGLAVGLILAIAVGQLAAKFLYGVTGLDPITFTLIPITLGAVALIACWLPARRATKVNPMTALRCE